jgi:carboxypeptidase C (cathepsin A)
MARFALRLFLPSYTARWYHKKLSPEHQADLGKTLKEAEAFARDEYFPALMKGSSLSDEDSERLAAKLAGYTGLSVDYVKRSNLKVPIWRFVKELLRDERRTVGRFDSRYQGIDRDAAGDNADTIPVITRSMGPLPRRFTIIFERN